MLVLYIVVELLIIYFLIAFSAPKLMGTVDIFYRPSNDKKILLGNIVIKIRKLILYNSIVK